MPNPALEQKLKTGRQRGHLDLGAIDLDPFPASVWKVNEETYGEPFWTLVPISRLTLPRVGDASVRSNLVSFENAPGNARGTLPEAIANLGPDLEVLEMPKAGLASLGPGFGALERLVKCDASGNALEEAPELLPRAHPPNRCCCFASLSVLKLSGNRLSGRVSVSQAATPALVELDLSHNAIREIAFDGAAPLASLQRVDLSHNRIERIDVPNGACAAEIVTLDVSANAPFGARCGAFLGSLAQLPKLALLDISGTGVAKLPADELVACGCAAGLVELRAAGNAFAAVDGGVGALARLETVVLSGNAALERLDGGAFGRLAQLARLDVSGCALRDLPAELSRCARLKALACGGNPIRRIPRQVLDGGTVGLLKYLATRMPASAEGGAGGGSASADVTRIGRADRAGATSTAGREAAGSGVLRFTAADLATGATLAGAIAAAVAAAEERARDAALAMDQGGAPAQLCEVDASVDRSRDAADLRRIAAKLGPRAGRGVGAAVIPVDPLPATVARVSLSGNSRLGAGSGGASAPADGDNAARSAPFSGPSLYNWLSLCGPAGTLRVLDLGNCGVGALLPSSLAAVAPGLTEVILAGNPGIDPACLDGLRRAAIVDISECGISGPLPAGLYRSVPSLRVLRAAGNSIDALDDAGIAAWRESGTIEELDLTNNNIGTLNPTLGTLPLRGLLVEGNPIRTIRRPMLQKGTPALLEYLRDRIPA